MFAKRINIFAGHFGSGKTEVAVNYAMGLHKVKGKTCIVDLDIVNPFFRTADAKNALESAGVKVLLPRYANTNVDVPAIPPEVSTYFANKEFNVVFDIGGDDLGAKALGRYREELLSEDYDSFFVVNARRPMTDSVDKMLVMFRQVTASARIRFTGIVNNTNLLQFSTSEELLKGHELVKRFSEEVGTPIAFTSGLRDVIEPVRERLGTEVLILDKQILLPWDR